LDEPYELEPGTELLVTVLPKRPTDDEQEGWFTLSRNGLEAAYADNEIDYSLKMIKEANPEYEGR